MIGSPSDTSIGNLYLYRYDGETWSFSEEIFGETYVSIEHQESSQTNNFSLKQNYPNPFNPTTTINFSIPKTSFVTLKVYDVLGKEIATLVNEEKHAGNYNVKFKANGLPSGIYFYRIIAGEYSQTRKMIIMK